MYYRIDNKIITDNKNALKINKKLMLLRYKTNER